MSLSEQSSLKWMRWVLQNSCARAWTESRFSTPCLSTTNCRYGSDVDDYAANFTKGFAHDDQGRVNKSDYEQFLCALVNEDFEAVNKIKLGGALKLLDPLSIYSHDLVGPFQSTVYVQPPPPLGSAKAAGDLIQPYCMWYIRDLPFNEWTETNPRIQTVLNALNQLSNPSFASRVNAEGNVTTSTLFRGEGPLAEEGYYVSQFALNDWTEYGTLNKPKIYPYAANVDYMTDRKIYKERQNGVLPTSPNTFGSALTYLFNYRSGLTWAHNDPVCQPYFNALYTLQSLKVPANPLISTAVGKVSDYFVNMSTADVQDLITRAIRVELLHVWRSKWSILRLRPEAFAGLVDNAKASGTNPYNLSPELLTNPILSQVFDRYKNWLMPQGYAEGCPPHPSYLCGHCTTGAVATTILKAFFDNDFKIPEMIPDPDTNYQTLKPTGKNLYVWSELDKLATNYSYFRNASGIHYESEHRVGLKFGENIAIEMLKEHVTRYSFKTGFQFYKRNGDQVTITNYGKC